MDTLHFYGNIENVFVKSKWTTILLLIMPKWVNINLVDPEIWIWNNHKEIANSAQIELRSEPESCTLNLYRLFYVGLCAGSTLINVAQVLTSISVGMSRHELSFQIYFIFILHGVLLSFDKCTLVSTRALYTL